MQFEIAIYAPDSGKAPYKQWSQRLSKAMQAIVATRLARLRHGNFGDCKPLSGARGVYELRLQVGPGYRIYYGKSGDTLVILLCAGDKSTQKRDIEKAKELWAEWLQTQKEGRHNG